jgi:phosphoribosylamine--glycine ligase
MKILVVGSGGREHALAWKLANDSARPEVFCAPGNPGTAAVGTNLAIAANDIDGLLAWAKANKPALTVVGPEAPLCDGITDRFNAAGLKVFGPCKAAARLEGSKVFAKDVMIAAGVPTAKFARFSSAAEAKAYIRKEGAPIVVKADGLAAGKGVTVAATVEQAEAAVDEALVQKAFGDAGATVVVEECLQGEEASILALIDGKNIVMLASAQDHKRVFDGDQGPNTGGMGAYSPAPVVKESLWPVIRAQVFEPTLVELRKHGIDYRGVLYAGLMMTKAGPKVLEFNCRFGDPETQAILPRWDGDLFPALEACADGRLSEKMVRWKPDHCVCIVMAAGGYPGSYGKGDIIEGLAEAAALKDAVVFHAGTKSAGGNVVTAGGRVLGVTALGRDLRAAVAAAYKAVGKIKFAKAHWRKDIAARGMTNVEARMSNE